MTTMNIRQAVAGILVPMGIGGSLILFSYLGTELTLKRILRSKLAQALQDEQEAESFYRDLRRIAIDVQKDFVDTITEIQQDEADHYKKLKEILGKLAS